MNMLKWSMYGKKIKIQRYYIMSVIQTKWDPSLARCSYSTLSPHVPRDMVIDCTIHTLVGLGFLTVEKGIELSEKINKTRGKGSSYVNIIDFLNNFLNKDVKLTWIGNLELTKKILYEQLQVGNATMLSYEHIDKNGSVLGHTILVYRKDTSTLICVDIQKGVEYPIDELVIHGYHRIINAALYLEYERDPQAMELGDTENNLIYGGIYKKNKKSNKNKYKHTHKKYNKNNHKKSYKRRR